MRVDIIVPNFDDSSNKIVLSSWYKKVGDRIFKNEIIAEAETARIACGITSSYDCILARICTKEGEEISQGEKIAVIETDVNADISDIRNIEIAENAKKELKEVASEINNACATEKYPEAKTLSASAGNKFNAKKSSIKSENDIDHIKNSSFSFNKSDKYALNAAEAEEVEKGVENATLPVTKKIKDNIIDSLYERSGETVSNIMKEAEKKAKEEAKNLAVFIIEEAKKQAAAQAKEIKKRILNEYETKAAKEASEMYQKIVQGSITEAENSRAKLLDETREKAKKEATAIRDSILSEAKRKADQAAENIISDIKRKAIEEETSTIRQTKEEAEKKSKEIVRKAIAEAAAEAKTIKKNIIHSAQKHARRLSEIIIAESLKETRKNAKDFETKIFRSITDEIAKFIEPLKEKAKSEMNFFLSEAKTAIKELARKEKNSLEYAEKETKAAILSEPFFNEGRKKAPSSSVENARAKTVIEEKLAKKIVDDEVKELAGQEKIIKSLLNGDRIDNTSDMYAENWNKPTFFASPEDETASIDALKQRINERINASLQSSVISTVSNEVDMSAILTLEKNFGEAFMRKYNIRLGFTPFFILGSVEALKQYRVFNAHIRENEIIYKNTYDISIITCGNDGIIAPVIRCADSMTIEEIERNMIHLSRRAVEGTLSVEEVSGGTFTVVNAGVYGSLIGTDLLTPPQVATLSVHRMHDRPVATNNGVEVRPMLYVSLSYDHKAADTKLASGFLEIVKKYVENPGYALLGL